MPAGRAISERSRCPWPKGEESIRYHDEEWGLPIHDDRRLFEHLVLGGAQAGLSWTTILRKRDHYRAAFASFDPAVVARFGKRDERRLLANPGIVRNRLKIASAVANARAFRQVQEDFGTFDRFLWQFVDGRPLHNLWRAQGDVPSRTPLSDSLSKELKRRGFRFVGSTICYAVMQAVGMVNDHLVDCFRYAELTARASDSRKRKGEMRNAK